GRSPVLARSAVLDAGGETLQSVRRSRRGGVRLWSARRGRAALRVRGATWRPVTTVAGGGRRVRDRARHLRALLAARVEALLRVPAARLRRAVARRVRSRSAAADRLHDRS